MDGYEFRVGSRFVANDSLSILEMHRVGHVAFISPVKTCLQNNCFVLGVEFETTEYLINRAVSDLDLLYLSLWFAYLNLGPPIVSRANCATISSIAQSELELNFE